jgi:hypothetical protein
MLPYSVHLDIHNVHEDDKTAHLCKATFESYGDAELYAETLIGRWQDTDTPVVIRIAGHGRNLRLFPLRTGVGEYGVVAQKQPVGTIGEAGAETLEINE